MGIKKGFNETKSEEAKILRKMVAKIHDQRKCVTAATTSERFWDKKKNQQNKPGLFSLGMIYLMTNH